MTTVRIVKSAIFLLVFYILFFLISHVLVGEIDTYNYQQSAGFFEEPKDSLDAVYIGASPTFTSWIAPLAWKKYGIAVRTFANDNQPLVAAQNLLKIARKEQPNAVYMVAINGLYETDDLTAESVHRTTDFLPYSFERFSLIHMLCNDFNIRREERLALHIPIIRYHYRWDSLSKNFFCREIENTKGGFAQQSFLNEADDISGDFCETNERSPLSDFTQEALAGLLNYCEKENVKVVFVLSAQYRDEQVQKQYNTIIDEINESGFPLINEFLDFNTIGLNDHTDFYNSNHSNIHGALKITDYLAKYLIENYEFEDKRGNSVYKSWDEAYDQYSEIVKSYLTNEELVWLQ